MNRKNVAFALALMGSVLHPVSVNSGEPGGATRVIERTPWNVVQIPVYSAIEEHVFHIDGRTFTYGLEYGPLGRIDVAIVALEMKGTGHIWIGPWPDFFVDMKSGLLGATLQAGGRLVWMQGLAQATTRRMNLNEALKQFDKSLNPDSLFSPLPASAVTDLRRVFRMSGAGLITYNSRPERLKIDRIAISRDQIQLDLTSPESSTSGQVWIDLESREVVTAVEGGRKVFPP